MREPKRKEIIPQVIHEDEELLVINKPARWIVNDADTVNGQPTVQKWLRNNFEYPLVSIDYFRSGIVHRLDKETSGVLLIAKTEKFFHHLQKLFKERKVKKNYIALLHGKVEPRKGTIEATVGRLPWNRRRFGVLAGGRDSKTKYKVRAYYLPVQAGMLHSTHYTLVDFFPETGRTHQIRIHAKHIGHPIVGDEFYAGRKRARKDRIWCPRLFLHAASISFVRDGKNAIYKATLPSELTNALNLLEKLPAAK